MKKLDGVFPVWGPYSKKYMGISRIVDENMKSGVRFDCTASPAVFGSGARVPNTTVPCGCRAWHCNDDYSYFSYRFDLENKDDVYSEVSYLRLSDESTLIRTEIFNNTELIQNCLVNYFLSIEYRSDGYCDVSLPEKCLFIKADNYDEYEYKITRPWDEQNADAMKKGVFTDDRFYLGTGLGDRASKWHLPHRYLAPFGGEKGDRVRYTLERTTEFSKPTLSVRYRTSDIKYEQGKMVGVNYVPGNEDAVFILNGEKKLVFEATDELKIKSFELDSVPESIELVSQGKGAIEIDFIAVTENDDKEKIIVSSKSYDVKPEIVTECGTDGALSILKYKDTDGDYRLRTFDENTRFRAINTGCLEDCLSSRISNSDESFDDLTESFTSSFKDKHSDEGFFHNTLVHTVFVAPHTSEVIYAVISKGETEYLTKGEYDKIYDRTVEEYESFSLNSCGEKYELSNELLKAAALTNVVYPIYKHGRYIIHHTPGKRWDCLYTWDSGFIGLAFLKYAPTFADYILDTYLSDETNPDYAFVHHGSPVPVQFYIFNEQLNGERKKESAIKYYSRLKLYYDFFLGKIRGSTTAKFKSGLLTTYDYFYSSSGMDDYPAQVAMMHDELRDTAAPVITTAQAIRISKIMLKAAKIIGKSDDVDLYKKDIERLTAALDLYSWDEESGYYSYVLHDENYKPIGKYLTADGENRNKGLDGVYPLVAGACNENQKAKILSHLKSEKEMLSRYGISAVDTTASYFKVNGYWNGNIWFAHQWFLFKTMLDIGESDFAYEIAKRALDVWKRECEYAYYTFEMVNVVTGRGGWFHNFGALSLPINMWASSYYKKGTVTVGFDTLVKECSFSNDDTHAEITLTKPMENECVLIAVMNDKYEYSVECKQAVDVKQRLDGEIEITLSRDCEECQIVVQKKQ